MKKFKPFGKKAFDNAPFSMINKELKKAGAPPVNSTAAPSMQGFLAGPNPGRKAKM